MTEQILENYLKVAIASFGIYKKIAERANRKPFRETKLPES